MLIDKYNRIIVSKLPSNIAAELAEIKDNTDNFSDDDLMDIYKENFNSLFKLIEKEYPEAVKQKPTLVTNKSGKTKLVKKTVEKKKLVKKKEAKPKLIKKHIEKLPKHKYAVDSIVTIDEPGNHKYKVIGHKKYNKDYGWETKIERLDDKKTVTMFENTMYASDDDCETALAEIKAIHTKREQAATKRANAPKKKVSTAAGEKQVKTVTSIFKTSGFKNNKDKAEKFSDDLVKVYRKHGLDAIADKLQTEMQGVIENQYKK